MDFVVVNAYAKINLALNVINKREDGYHNLDMVMQSLKLCDNIFIKKTKDSGVKIKCNYEWLAKDPKNLILTAANYLIKNYNINQGVYIDLTKNIPVSAGLAGGSSDCAATLLAMRSLFDLPITDLEMIEIGKKMGADVPFCLFGKTARARGIGDELKPLGDLDTVIVVVVKPNVRVSTAEVFSKFDKSRVSKSADIEAMEENITNKDLIAITQGFSNDLESVTIKEYPVIERIKRKALEYGALGALMSGSGPSVFAFFKNTNDAYSAVKCIRKQIGETKEIFITKTFCPRDGRILLSHF